MANDVEKAKVLFFEALGSIERSDYVTAERTLRAALPYAPKSASILTNLAAVLARQGQYAEATTHAEQAVTANNSNLEALLVLADCYAKEERHTEALNVLDRALAIDGTLADAHNNRGIIVAKRGDHAGALACYERAIQLEPNYSDAHKNRGNALSQLGRHDEALRAYDSALARKHDPAEIWLERGNVSSRLNRFDEALAAYRTALNFNPDMDGAAKAAVGLLLSQGRSGEAFQTARKMLEANSSSERKALVAMCLRPGLPDPAPADIEALLLQAMTEPWVRPADLASTCVKYLLGKQVIHDAIANAGAITQQTVQALGRERLLLALLEAVPIADLGFERFLTQLRSHLLMSARSVHRDVDEQALSAYCALAKQCFINNYVFQIGQDEQDLARNLRASLTAAIAAKTPIDALMLAATACYFRLCDLPDAASLLDQNWPKPVAALLEQQVAAPLEESRLRAAIPCLTPITDAVSIAVREQYEQNPYPQWMKLPRGDDAKPLHKYFHERFPMSPFKQMENGRDEIDILIAGCGTGQQSIEAARRFTRSKVLAVDLSMASLCYAARQTRALGQENIRYAQADIMRLGETGLSFDVIESTGVLHHLADPLSGWRVLLSLLRPGGVMFVALYSEIARRDIVAAQNHAAARGYRPTPGDIRRCRADIIESPPGSPLRNVMAARDFFSLDECRDLLFHVQESRFTLPQIASFLAENGLDLIGFELEPSVWRGYSQAFPADQAMTNLTNWHAYETKHPDTFFGMYNFWIQKRRNSGQ